MNEKQKNCEHIFFSDNFGYGKIEICEKCGFSKTLKIAKLKR